MLPQTAFIRWSQAKAPLPTERTVSSFNDHLQPIPTGVPVEPLV
jgi:hypothetical protein